ncbi:hypothetical protein M5K25_028047 [Dendrobium thyrsiflorum]|uniref:Secreted protein n=1 Tax=Dendrobium thyrsiflorum TaxID=117978 RepID=A0ABD0TVP2_DENTH
MVFYCGWVVMVARASAYWWQSIACNPERLSSDDVLNLLCCLPLYHLRRLSLRLFSFLCVPYNLPHRRRYRILSYDQYSSSSSSSDDSDSDHEDSHSD